MFTIPQSTAWNAPLQAYLSSDHVSNATGKTIAITISKNGAAYGNPSGGATNATEIANGSYYVGLTTTDTGTLGPLFVRGTASATDDVILILNVVKATNGGWTAIPDTAATTNASLLTSGTGTDQLSVASGRVDLGKILGTASAGAVGYVGLDWGHINAPTTAVNLSATQIQSVNNLASGSDSVNTIATSGSTLTTGSSVSGTYASTAQLDSVYWQIADAAGTLDMYFEFNVGTNGVPTTAVWTGGLMIATNSLKVYAYNWGGSSWDQIGTLNGTTSLVISNLQLDFTTAHVGTGGNLGLVRLRFANTGLTTANFYTDQVLCGYTNVYSFPTNFSSLAITGGGAVTAGTVSDKTGYSLSASQTFNTTGNLSGSVGSVTGAVGSVTGNVGGNVSGSVASVLTGGLIDLTTTTYAESAGVVGATATLKDMLVWLKTLGRNKITQTATTETLYANDGSTPVSTSVDSDDGTTFTRGVWS